MKLKLLDARSIVCTSVAYSPDGQTVAVVNAGIKGNRSPVPTDDLLFELRVLDAHQPYDLVAFGPGRDGISGRVCAG